MLIWRLCKQRHVSSAFSGIGAEKLGGRWNHQGYRVVYASSSLSLACLELFVHLEPDCIPDDMHSIVATIPDSVSSEELSEADLPKNWREYPAPSRLKDIGSQWLREQRSLILIVPSAVNPDERNVLVNPLHPEAKAIAAISSKSFQFDPRMWKR
jgi:RES domain-containing protein